MRTPTVTTRLQLDDAKGEPIAHCTISHRAGVLWLTDVWTHADHRKQGHARQLITQALGMFPDRAWYLEVYPYTDQPLDAAALVAFYAGFGFAETDVPGVMRKGHLKMCHFFKQNACPVGCADIPCMRLATKD